MHFWWFVVRNGIDVFLPDLGRCISHRFRFLIDMERTMAGSEQLPDLFFLQNSQNFGLCDRCDAWLCRDLVVPFCARIAFGLNLHACEMCQLIFS